MGLQSAVLVVLPIFALILFRNVVASTLTGLQGVLITLYLETGVPIAFLLEGICAQDLGSYNFKGNIFVCKSDAQFV